MTRPDPRHPHATDTPSSPEERAWVARFAAHYAPPPQSAGRRARFDAALGARLDRVRRRRGALRRATPLAVAAGTACLVCGVWLGALAPDRAPSAAADAPRLLSAWERGIVLGDLDALERDDADGLVLPADYAAIDGLLVAGS